MSIFFVFLDKELYHLSIGNFNAFMNECMVIKVKKIIFDGIKLHFISLCICSNFGLKFSNLSPDIFQIIHF